MGGAAASSASCSGGTWHALGRPFLPPGQPPLDVAGYLEMIGLGEMLARYDRPGAADPGFYRDAAYLHGALTAGADMGPARPGDRRVMRR